MPRPQPERVVTMTAGVRLIAVGRPGSLISYAISSLRNHERPRFDALGDARRAFDAEVEISRKDPVVGPYVR